jgi:hypothetical protein
LPYIDSDSLPPYKDWHDDGVNMFDSSYEDVLLRICSIEEGNPLSLETVQSRYIELAQRQHWAKASTIAHGVLVSKKLDTRTTQEDWEQKRFTADLAVVHLTLREGLILPLSEVNNDVESISTPCKVKHLAQAHSVAIALAEENPEAMAPYLELFDSLYLEMILNFPAPRHFLHQVSKTFSFDSFHPAKLSIYQRIRERDEAWKNKASEVFHSRISHELDKELYGRAIVLISEGLAAGLVSEDFTVQEFLRKLDQINIAAELPDHLAATNSMVVPHEFPRLTHLSNFLPDACALFNPNLSEKLEQIVARRHLEAIYQLRKSDIGFNKPGLDRLLDTHEYDLASILPQNDPSKTRLLAQGIAAYIEDLTNRDHPSAVATHDAVTNSLMHNKQQIIDDDTLQIHLSKLEECILSNFQKTGVNFDTLELLIAYLSPLCREDQDYRISKSFLHDTASILTQSDDEEIVAISNNLENNVRCVWNDWWQIHEEYYT